jgi:hypothetical protein
VSPIARPKPESSGGRPTTSLVEGEQPVRILARQLDHSPRAFTGFPPPGQRKDDWLFVASGPSWDESVSLYTLRKYGAAGSDLVQHVGIGSIRAAICSRMASLQRGWGGGGGAADRLFEPDTVRPGALTNARRSDGEPECSRPATVPETSERWLDGVQMKNRDLCALRRWKTN